jgi:hypothetical protein
MVKNKAALIKLYEIDIWFCQFSQQIVLLWNTIPQSLKPRIWVRTDVMCRYIYFSKMEAGYLNCNKISLKY